MRGARFTIGCLLALALAVPALAVAPNVRVIDQDEYGIVFEVRYGDLEWGEEQIAGTWVSVPNLGGATLHMVPGEPILPVQTVTFAAPPSAALRIDVEKASAVSVDVESIPVAPKIDVDLDEKTTTATRYPDWVPGGPGLTTPATDWIALADDGYLRDRRAVVVRINPLRFDAATGAASAASRLRIRVSFDWDPLLAKGVTPRPDPVYRDRTRSLFVNGNTADRLGFRDAKPAAAPKRGLASASKDEAVKVYVNRRGLYRLTPDDYTDLGLDPSGIDPRTFQVHVNGEQVRIYVAGEGDGSFDAGDYLVFYGVPVENDRYLDTNCYWVTSGDANGLRAAEVDASVGGGQTVPDSFPWTERTEDSTGKYWTAMTDWEDYDDWYWERLSATESLSVTANAPDPASGGTTASITTAYHGRTDTAENPDHHTVVTLNGTEVQNETWDGINYFEMTDTFSHSLLDSSGANTLVFSLPGDTGAIADQEYINWIEIAYDRQYLAAGDALRFTGPAAGTYEFNVGGFDTSDVQIFDVTDPAAMVRLTGVGISGTTAYEADFELTVVEGDWFEAAGEDGYRTPKDVKVDVPSSLATAANGADWIVITHDALESAVTPLATYRAAQGYRTAVVMMEDVYDEFSYGAPEPLAIQAFLEYAYNNWESPAPLYVLLFGDATVDYKEYRDNTVGRNPVPSYLTHTPGLGGTPSENAFFLLSGDDLPDFFTGRVPAEDAAYATGVVDKIIAAEDAAFAAWHEETTFAADDNPEIFEVMSDEVILLMPDDYQSAVERLYIGDIGGSAVKAGLIAAINEGRGIVNYFGHGSVENWAGEYIMRSTDIPSLANAGKYPFVTVFNCLNAFFPLVEVDRYCLNEAFIRYANKGASASFGATGYGYASEHFVLAQRIWHELFDDAPQLELGAATTLGRIDAYTNYGTTYEVVDTYILFGDPAMPLRRDLTEIDGDEDTYTRDVDCDDTDPEIHPDAVEICDGVDNNCVDGVDEGCTEFDIPIVAGENFLALSVEAGNIGSAAEIVADIEDDGGSVVELAVWDRTASVWRIYDAEYAPIDFDIDPDEGFYVLANSASTWNVTAQAEVTESLPVIDGFVLLGVPTDDYANVADLISAMNSGGCDVLGVSRRSGGAWDTYETVGGGTNFALDRMTAYFVEGGGDGSFAIAP